MEINLNKEELNKLLKYLPQKEIKLRRKLNRRLSPIKPQSRKSKGREFQKQVCKDIAEKFGFEFNQRKDNSEVKFRPMGQSGVDIILLGEARKLFPFSIECKNTNKLTLETFKQAIENEEKEMNWLIIQKRKGLKNPIAILDWYVFLEFWNTEQ